MVNKFQKFVNQVKNTFKKAQPHLGTLKKFASQVEQELPAGLAKVSQISTNLAPVLNQVNPKLGNQAGKLGANLNKASNISAQGIQALKGKPQAPPVPVVQEQPPAPAVIEEAPSPMLQFS